VGQFDCGSGLENGRSGAHIGRMENPILATLKMLVQQADTNGLLLAERAIDEHLALCPNDHQRAEAILILEGNLLPLWESSSGAQLDLMNTVLAYLEKRSLEIQERNDTPSALGTPTTCT
jgi:hypothetical protein